MQLKMCREDLQTFLSREFPQVASDFEVLHVAPMEVTVRCQVNEKHLRPGATVSGPSMFALADVAMYLAILAMLGPKALSVTTNFSIDFMRKPVADKALIAKARLHKLGRVLAVGDVFIYSEGNEGREGSVDRLGGSAPVARASLTYSIPPKG